MEKTLKYGEDAVVARLDTTEAPLVFPAFAVAAQFAFVLKRAVADVLSAGDNQLRSLLVAAHAQSVGTIAAICWAIV